MVQNPQFLINIRKNSISGEVFFLRQSKTFEGFFVPLQAKSKKKWNER